MPKAHLDEPPLGASHAVPDAHENPDVVEYLHPVASPELRKRFVAELLFESAYGSDVLPSRLIIVTVGAVQSAVYETSRLSEEEL